MATTAIAPEEDIFRLRAATGGYSKHHMTEQVEANKRRLKVAVAARDLRAIVPLLTAAERAEMHAIVAGGSA